MKHSFFQILAVQILMLLFLTGPLTGQEHGDPELLQLHPYARYFSDHTLEEERHLDVQKELQPLVNRIVRNNNRLYPLQAEMLPLVSHAETETVLHTNLVMHKLQQIALLVDAQAHILGASLYIEPDYRRSFYQRRKAELQAASNRINDILSELDSHYRQIKVNGVLHQIDLARELVQPSLSMFEEIVILINEMD